MAIPLTSQEAEQAGLKKASAAEVTQLKTSGAAVRFDSAVPNSICYMGPCSGGSRTICYKSDTGCDNCYTSSEGC
jgi:hypothetical protein